jgi:hypothetical protein
MPSGYPATVGMSVVVRTFRSLEESASTHRSIGELCRLAADAAFPMLRCVDPYDNTVFNRSQMRLVIPELRALIELADRREADAGREILELAQHVERQHHRYLIFNGD